MNVIILTRPEKIASAGFGYHRDRMIAFIESCGNSVDIRFGRIDQNAMSRADIGLSFFYPFILRINEFSAPKFGTVNCHPGLLPLQRGVAPNVFAIVNKEPAGTTLHYMNASVDKGPIIAQSPVEIAPTDTGESLYKKLVEASANLVIDTWPVIQDSMSNGKMAPSHPQPIGNYKTNTLKDFSEMGDLENRFGETAPELIDWLRSLTFPGYNNAFVRDEKGRKVYVRVELSYE